MDSSLNNLSPDQLAAMEALRQSLEDLQESTAQLLKLTQSLPAGKVRDELLKQVGWLDSITDRMRQELDACG